jgi:transcriptional regulator with XRE-family HTH domain
MDVPVNTEQFRRAACEAIKKKFQALVKTTKDSGGSLTEIARQLGVKRQMLGQYAHGSVPASDVLLAAFLKWGWVLKVEGWDNDSSWCEFSLSRSDKRLPKRAPEPVQLSLFDALAVLDENLDTLKKSVGRVESEIQRVLGKPA